MFHAKKADTNNAGIRTPDGNSILVNQTPAVAVRPVIKIDPLASYTPPVVEAKPVIIETPTVDPLMNTEPAAIPSWLQVPKTDEVVTPTREEPIRAIPVPEETPSIEMPVVPIVETHESAVPSWLQVTDTPSIDESIATEEPQAADILVPDIALTPEILPVTVPPEPSSDALPDWLVDSLRAPEVAPVTESIDTPEIAVAKPEKKKKPKKIETPKESPAPSPATSPDIPDWLK